MKKIIARMLIALMAINPAIAEVFNAPVINNGILNNSTANTKALGTNDNSIATMAAIYAAAISGVSVGGTVLDVSCATSGGYGCTVATSSTHPTITLTGFGTAAASSVGSFLSATGNALTATSASAITGKTFSGTGSQLATASGVLTSGHCVSIDANGNVVDAGAACGSGSSPLTTNGDLYTYQGTNTRLAIGSNGQCLTSNGASAVWGSCAAGGAGTVTSVSGVAANGFSFSIANPTTTPTQTLSTTITGMIKGSAGALAQAFAGTDYLSPSGDGSALTGTAPNLSVQSATSATQLAATPSACSAGSYATGIAANGSAVGCTAAAGGGTVTTVSVTTQSGVSGTVTNPTTTPAITIALGAITPTSINTGSGVISGVGSGLTSIPNTATTATTANTASAIMARDANGLVSVSGVNTSGLSTITANGDNWVLSGGTSLLRQGSLSTAIGNVATYFGSSPVMQWIMYNMAIGSTGLFAGRDISSPVFGYTIQYNGMRSRWDAASAAAGTSSASWTQTLFDDTTGYNGALGQSVPAAVTYTNAQAAIASGNASSSVLAYPLTTANYFTVTSTSGVPITAATVSGCTSGKMNSWQVLVSASSIGATSTFIHPTSTVWPAGTAPTMTTTASKRDSLFYWSTDCSTFFGSIIGQNY